MEELFTVRQAARQAGRDTFEGVRAYLEGLDDTRLVDLVAAFESRKTVRARMKTRESKIRYLVAQVCHGDAFLS